MATLEEARIIPSDPAVFRGSPVFLSICGGCGKRVRPVLFTTAGSGAQAAIWSAYLLALDAWLCSCGQVVAPRRVPFEEIEEY